MTGLIDTFDKDVMIFIKNSLYVKNIGIVMSFISFLGNLGFIWIVTAVYFSIKDRNKWVGIVMTVSLLVSFITVDLMIKGVFDRERPFEAIEGIALMTNKPFTSSFPSGHAASSFLAAVVLSHFYMRRSIYFFLLAFMISISRIYLFLHYPSDMAAGMLFGLAIGYFSIFLFKKIIH